MNNPKLKLLVLTLILTFVIFTAVYGVFSNLKQAKIFGCTLYDIYEGSNHKKLDPEDLYCNLDLLEIAPNARANDAAAGLVEYDLNIMGIITVAFIFVILPFILAYTISLQVLKRVSKNSIKE